MAEGIEGRSLNWIDLDAAGLGVDVSCDNCFAIGTELPELFGDECEVRREGRRADMMVDL